MIATGSPSHARGGWLAGGGSFDCNTASSRRFFVMSAGALPSKTIAGSRRTAGAPPFAFALSRTALRKLSRCSSGSQATWNGLLFSTSPPASL